MHAVLVLVVTVVAVVPSKAAPATPTSRPEHWSQEEFNEEFNEEKGVAGGLPKVLRKASNGYDMLPGVKLSNSFSFETITDTDGPDHLCQSEERQYEIDIGGKTHYFSERFCNETDPPRESDSCSELQRLRFQRSCEEGVPKKCVQKPAYSCGNVSRIVDITEGVLTRVIVACVAVRC